MDLVHHYKSLRKIPQEHRLKTVIKECLCVVHEPGYFSPENCRHLLRRSSHEPGKLLGLCFAESSRTVCVRRVGTGIRGVVIFSRASLCGYLDVDLIALAGWGLPRSSQTSEKILGWRKNIMVALVAQAKYGSSPKF